MARWSGAKARCGYYARDYSDGMSGSEGYRPLKGESPKSGLTVYNVSCFIIFGFMGIGIMPLVALPVLLIIVVIYLLNNCNSYISVNKLNKDFKVSERSVEQIGTNLTFHKKSFGAVAVKNGWYVLDTAENIIQKLNKGHDGGFSDWRIPTYSEMDSLFDTAENRCTEIYSKTKRTYSVGEIFKKIGMNDMRPENYICKGYSWGRESLDSKNTPYFKDMHFGCRSDSVSQGEVYLLPVRGGKRL